MTMTTSRRAILAGAASLATVPALAKGISAPDPIFAAIERHRAAYIAHGQSCTEGNRLAGC